MEEDQISPAGSFNEFCEEESVMESWCGDGGGTTGAEGGGGAGGVMDPEESDVNVDEIDVDMVPKAKATAPTTTGSKNDCPADTVNDVAGHPPGAATQKSHLTDKRPEDTVVLVPSECGSSQSSVEKKAI